MRMLDIIASSYVTQSWAICSFTAISVVVLILRSMDNEERRKAENSKRSDQEEALRGLQSEIRYLRQELPRKKS